MKALNADKLKRELEKFTSLKKALSLLSDVDPVTISMYSTINGGSNFSIGRSMDARMGFADVIKGLLKEEKDVIRRKYNIDVK